MGPGAVPPRFPSARPVTDVGSCLTAAARVPRQLQHPDRRRMDSLLDRLPRPLLLLCLRLRVPPAACVRGDLVPGGGVGRLLVSFFLCGIAENWALRLL